MGNALFGLNFTILPKELCYAVLFIAFGYVFCRRLDLRGCVAHRNAYAAFFQHFDIVRIVSEGDGIAHGNALPFG